MEEPGEAKREAVGTLLTVCNGNAFHGLQSRCVANDGVCSGTDQSDPENCCRHGWWLTLLARGCGG
jgi:hypothetical protein